MWSEIYHRQSWCTFPSQLPYWRRPSMGTTCPGARAGTYQSTLCCWASYKTPLLSTLNQFDISGEYLGRSFSCPNSPSVPYSLPSPRWNSFTSSLWPTMMERSCFTPSPSWRQLSTWYGIGTVVLNWWKISLKTCPHKLELFLLVKLPPETQEYLSYVDFVKNEVMWRNWSKLF